MKLAKKVRFGTSLAALAAVGMATPAIAATVVLDFEGVNSTYPSGFAFVGDFYNGGTSSDGTSGTNYGVSFSGNAQAICLNTPGTSCSNTSRGGEGDPGSQLGGLFFLSGSETYLNYAGGFDTGFSFYYAAPNTPGSIGVYDGLNGTGNLLATLALGLTPSTCTGLGVYCPFEPIGVSFSGTAQSIAFAGVANFIVFDDVTFGSATPGNGAVPEPATWAMMIGGFGMMGAVMRRRRRRSPLAFA